MKRSRRRPGRIPLVGDMIFSMLSLPMALAAQDLLTNTPDHPDVYGIVPLALFLMGVARLFRAFRYRRESRFQFIRYLVYGGVMMSCLPVMAVIDDSKRALEIIGIIYWSTIAVNRVIDMVRDRSLRSLLLNLLLLFLIAFLCAGFAMERDVVSFILIAMLIVVYQALLSIMAVAFSRINLKVLGRVIRESYAAEVLLGLLLLIISFSYCLRSWEPAITSLGDAMWYCFAIVTTIGFGDVSAVTWKGRVLSIILGMYGILVVSLITSIIVNFYGEMRREKE